MKNVFSVMFMEFFEKVVFWGDFVWLFGCFSFGCWFWLVFFPI